MNDIDAFEFHEAFSVSHFKDTYQRTITIKGVVHVCGREQSIVYNMNKTEMELYI